MQHTELQQQLSQLHCPTSPKTPHGPTDEQRRFLLCAPAQSPQACSLPLNPPPHKPYPAALPGPSFVPTAQTKWAHFASSERCSRELKG